MNFFHFPLEFQCCWDMGTVRSSCSLGWFWCYMYGLTHNPTPNWTCGLWCEEGFCFSEQNCPFGNTQLLGWSSPSSWILQCHFASFRILLCCLWELGVCFELLWPWNVMVVQQYLKHSHSHWVIFEGFLQGYHLNYDLVWGPPVSDVLPAFCSWQKNWQWVALCSSQVVLCNLCMVLITNSPLSLGQAAVALWMISA